MVARPVRLDIDIFRHDPDKARLPPHFQADVPTFNLVLLCPDVERLFRNKLHAVPTQTFPGYRIPER